MVGNLGLSLGIDLGTANVLVYVKGKGIVLREPSVVAINKETKRIMAVGVEARQMLGKTPDSIIAVRPLQDGVIANYSITESMLQYFIAKVCGNSRFFKPRIVICVPSGATGVERRAVLDATLHAGAKQAFLIEESMAAAIGAGLPVSEPRGHMIVDIGGGTTDIAVISLGGVVVSSSVRVGGDRMDEALVKHVKKAYNVVIGEPTAEEIKMRVGSVYPVGEPRRMEIRGRDGVTGLPCTIPVSEEDVREALQETVLNMAEQVKMVLERTPPELAADIIETGLTLTGGGALLRGLNLILQEATHIRVTVADDPLSCVVIGTGRALDEIDILSKSMATIRKSAIK
ncbi:MAG: rod shape-determining protein [bacterium]|nr:rod shape-determining protein [bacterium]